ncbi:hypothetical protein [Corynebacterium aurimucosum]|nr:hypothetical protein [Corynebacterium aurimucosum]
MERISRSPFKLITNEDPFRTHGFSNVYSLRGGIDAWQEHNDT